MIDEIFDKLKNGKKRLNYWLRLDYWGIEHVAWLLLNVDPDSLVDNGKEIYTLNLLDEKSPIYSFEIAGETPFDEDLDKENSHLIQKYSFVFHEYIERLTDHKVMGGGLQELLDFRESPSFWIYRAQAKKIKIPWLDYAIKEGYFDLRKPESTIEKSLSNKERETLLIIIAALAKEAGVNIDKSSKSGELIANMTELLGSPVGATTIETHLKKINQALANRAK